MFGDFGDTSRREKDGILVTGHQNILLGNNVFNCRTGIRLASGNRNRVLGNRCEKNGYYGIEVNSYENNIVSNQCWNNGAEARRDRAPSAGIHVLNRSANTVSGNMLFNLATSDDPFQDIGILLQGSHEIPASYNAISNNVVRDCHVDGIRLADYAHDNSVIGNVVQIGAGEGNPAGIHLTGGASRNQVLGNQAMRLSGGSGSFQGVVIDAADSTDNLVSDNAIVAGLPSDQVVDGGTRTRLNGLLQIAGDEEDRRALENGELEPGRLVYDRSRGRVFVTTEDGPVRLA